MTGRNRHPWIALLWLPSLLAAPLIAQGDFEDTPLPEAAPSAPSDEGLVPGKAIDRQQSPSPSPSDDPGGTNSEDPSLRPSPDSSAAAPAASSQGSRTNRPSTKRQSSPSKGGLLSDDVTDHDDTAPIHVKGEIVKGLRSMGRLDLEGNVEILQAGAKLLSDAATILTDPGTSRTKKAIAKGNVKFSKDSTIDAPPLKAEAEEMEYFVAERKIIMTGKPKVWRGAELIQGKEITLELDTGAVTIRDARGVVEPSNLSEPKP